MSSISGIGGAMGISVGVGMSAGASAGAGAAPGAAGAGQAPNAGVPESLQSLANTMKDFSSAEILIALMLSGSGKDKDKGDGGSAAGGFLAGMALAGMMGQQSHLNLQFNMPAAGGGDVAGGAAGVGLSLNVSV